MLKGGVPDGMCMATSFASSRVRKRFLKEMVPLGRLLGRHGFECSFPFDGGSPTLLCIERGGRLASVLIFHGERRYRAGEAIFILVEPCEGPAKELVGFDQFEGAIEVLLEWGMLSLGEITQAELEETRRECAIRCAGCQEEQRGDARFKQCGLCHERDASQWLAEYNGLYCNAMCQANHWAAHRRECHTTAAARSGSGPARGLRPTPRPARE
jgi:hypothetical protein